MAIVQPFAAVRPQPELSSKICELPYDVMSSDEARQIASGNPLSFLHVSKPEIDLSPDLSIYDPQVYAQGKKNFEQLIHSHALFQDGERYFYLYRQQMGPHIQTGLVAVVSCREYLDGVIKKHEFTRPDKEDDRVRHIEALNAQTGPAFLTYRSNPAVNAAVDAELNRPPEIDYTAPDGIRHSAWTITHNDRIQQLERAFEAIPALYIADGHHRSAAAGRVFQSRNGEGESGLFLAVIFPHDQLQILPYNRVVADLNGLSPDAFLEKVGRLFKVESSAKKVPTRTHEVCLYFQKTWRTLEFRDLPGAGADPLENLDVSLLQNRVLQPLLGIDDPRTSKRIQFVGGIRGPAELERLVDSGKHACAFSMFPTGIEALMAIADLGGVMPPKSTWFEPKLRDGMFSHLI